MADIRVGLLGSEGRMGRAVTDALTDTVGMVAGPAADRDGDAAAVFAGSDVVIDFTPPGHTARHAGLAAAHGTACVVGTTGLAAADHAAMDAAAMDVALVQAGNFSLGVNLLTAFTRRAAAILDDGWDIEILEMHHRHKVDAPSGTATLLGEAAAHGRGVALDDVARRSRDGVIGERPAGEIGFATLRGGSVIGEHEVIFAAGSERLVLAHRAEDRGLFARGALTAARWAATAAPGRYDMLDVLGLKD
ncbi:4-hydroxy-tetrahydrodipicolinate reductase [Eilatimonas milleporae]|nr:4-hydroxy-tetrahydrodipicolinate reductase [Eilatimonas milleporae]